MAGNMFPLAVHRTVAHRGVYKCFSYQEHRRRVILIVYSLTMRGPSQCPFFNKISHLNVD